MPSATTVAELAVVVTADTTKAEEGLSSLGSKIGGIGSSLGGLAAGTAVAGVAALGAAFVGAVSTAADFEKQLSAISAVSGATSEQLDGIRTTALQLGKDTSFSASEAAAGMEEMVKAGVSLDDVMSGAGRAALDLAAAGGLSVAEAATVASNAMNQFSKSGSDMGHIADVIAGAANASAIDVHDFGFSLSAAGAVASTVGLSFEDTSTAIAVLGQAGLKGSDAGTSLKTMLLNLNPSSKAAQTEMQKLGIITADGANKFFDAAGNVKGMSEVAQVLQDSMQGLTKEQQINALQTAFGTDAIRAAAIMAKAGAAGFDTMADSMGKVTAQAVATERLNNLAGSFEQLKGSLETAAITVGMAFLPALKDLTDAVTSLVNDALPSLQSGTEAASETFKAWLPTIEAVVKMLWDNRSVIEAVVVAIGTFVLITTVIGWVTAAVTAFQTLSTVLGLVAIGFESLGVIGGIAALLNPVTLIVGAIALAVGALYLAWVNDWGGIQEKTQAVIDFIVPYVQAALATVEGFWRDHGAQVLSLLQIAWSAVETYIGTELAVIFGVIKAAMQVFSGDWSGAWDTAKTTVQTAMDGIATLVGLAFDALNVLTDGKFTVLLTSYVDGWNTVLTATSDAWNGTTGILATVGTAMSTMGSTVQGVMSGNPDSIVAVTTAGFGLMHDAIDTALGTDSAPGSILGIVHDGLAVMVGLTQSLLAGDTASVSYWAQTGFMAAKDHIDAIFGAGTGDTITGVVSAGWAAVVDLTKQLGQSGSDLLKAAGEVGSGIVASIQDGINGALDGFWAWLKSNFTDQIPSYIKDLLGIKSPSSVMADIGRSLVDGLRVGMESKLGSVEDVVKRLSRLALGVGGGGGDMPGSVTDWLNAAIKYTGVSSDWLDPLKWIVSHESGGDPTAKNPKSTAAGLFQMIDTTWAASRDKNLPNDIFNPIINAIAGIRYIKDRYGNPDKAVEFWKEHNHYAAGGWAGLNGPELALLGERGPEYVVPHNALASGGAHSSMTINVAIGGRVAEQIVVEGYELAVRRGRLAGAVS
jgi:TP901 family phage tail tape measure protein